MSEKDEFEVLESALKGLGLYENGMELDEMRKIQSVINESIEESSVAFEEELQAALLASEEMANESLQKSNESQESSSSCSPVNNSNFMQLGQYSTPPSSPDRPRIFNVTAEIHPESSDQSTELEPTEVSQENDYKEKRKTTDNMFTKGNDLLKNGDDIYSIEETNNDKL